MVAGIVLAAGAGTRFGGSVKPLVPFRGRPLVEWPLAALAGAGLDEVVVVLGARAAEVQAGADLGEGRVIVAEDWEAGLSRSLVAGFDEADVLGADAVVVVLGDQPLISAEAVRRVVAARSPAALAVRATYAGRPGHPVLLERSIWPEISALTGDQGAAAALRSHTVVEIACDDAGSDADVDTPADLRDVT